MQKNFVVKFSNRYILPIILILFSCFYSFLSYRLFKETSHSTEIMGPATFPFLISIALGGFAFLELLSIRKANEVKSSQVKKGNNEVLKIKGHKKPFIPPKGFLFDILVLVIATIYVLGMPLIGFLFMTIFLMVSMMFVAGERKIFKLLFYSIITSFSMYYGFIKQLYIPIPFLPWD